MEEVEKEVTMYLIHLTDIFKTTELTLVGRSRNPISYLHFGHLSKTKKLVIKELCVNFISTFDSNSF